MVTLAHHFHQLFGRLPGQNSRQTTWVNQLYKPHSLRVYRILWRYRIGTKPAGVNIRKKIPNEVFVRHLLATRKQRQDESIEYFFQSFESLRRDCNFRDRTTKQVGDEAVWDAFFCGITSPVIWLRLLENKTVTPQGSVWTSTNTGFSPEKQWGLRFPPINPLQPLTTVDYSIP